MESIRDYVGLGIEIAEILNAYYVDSLVKFIKNEPLKEGETSGAIYFGFLKPLYDKYGYETVNQYLINYYDLKKQGGKQDNE